MQLRDYLGQPDFKGVPLLDPTVDWDSQFNWPIRFSYQNRIYQLEITDLSGDEIRTLRSKAQVRPGMTVLFGYELVDRGPTNTTTKFIFPRASWSGNVTRASGKILIWGDRTFGGTWKVVFDYDFYPAGGLHQFHWQARDSEEARWEVFDRAGKLVGVKSPKTCFWNGVEVSNEKFLSLSRALHDSGGTPVASPSLSGARSNSVPRRR
jgi:hypothetical protein